MTTADKLKEVEQECEECPTKQCDMCSMRTTRQKLWAKAIMETCKACPDSAICSDYGKGCWY